MNSEQTPLLFRAEPVRDLLGDQGGATPGAVVDDEVYLDLVFYSLVHDLTGILDHLRVQHAIDHLVKREGFGVGILIAHPKGSEKPDNYQRARVEKLRPYLSKLFPERRQPDPVGKDQSFPILFQDLKDWIRQVCLGAKVHFPRRWPEARRPLFFRNEDVPSRISSVFPLSFYLHIQFFSILQSFSNSV